MTIVLSSTNDFSLPGGVVVFVPFRGWVVVSWAVVTGANVLTRVGGGCGLSDVRLARSAWATLHSLLGVVYVVAVGCIRRRC